MHIRHLKDDEVLYELALRDINPKDPKGLGKLQDIVSFEIASRTAPPLDLARLTRNTVQLELKECDAKGADDEELFLRGRSRLLHITARVLRLKRFAPGLEAVLRLVNRTLEVAGHCSITRHSIDNVDVSATNIDEQIEVAANSRSSTGAIPKRTSSTTIEQSNIEQRLSTIDKPTASSERTCAPPSQSVTQPLPQSMQQLNEDFSRMLAIHLQNAVQPSGVPVRLEVPIVNEFADGGRASRYSSCRNERIQAFNDQVQRHQEDNRSQYDGSYQSDAEDEVPRRHRYGQQARPNLIGGHRIHQWSLHFDGGANGLDAEDFLFRVERQAELYGVSQGALVIGFGELLRGRAEQWYWTFQRQYGNITWMNLTAAFLRRFSPHRETDYDLRSKIEARKQRPGEPFKDFCQDVEALSSRLACKIPEAELVEILQRNMQMTLRKALWRDRVRYVDELIRICTDYKRLCKEEDLQNWRYRIYKVSYEMNEPLDESGSHQKVKGLRMTDDLAICFNCKEMGHRFSQCKVPQNHIFCYWCGTDGVLSGNCHKCAENYKRDGTAAVVCSQQQPQQPRPKQILGPSQRKPWINKFSKPPPLF